MDVTFTNPGLCLYSVSSKFGLSEIYLSIFFKEQVGENFHQYLEGLRMSKAYTLLSQSALSIKEIGKEIGYNNYNTFLKAFRRRNGISPKEFRLQQIIIKRASIDS